MPRDEETQGGSNVGSDGKTWAEWKQELSDAIEELDKACAHARQVIYRLRPLVRPKPRKNEEDEERGEERQPAPLPQGRGRYRGRGRE
jgi:hypothetical protein